MTILLALAFAILLIVMLVELGVLPPIIDRSRLPTTLQLLPETEAGSSARSVAKTKHASAAAARRTPAPAKIKPPPPIVPPLVPWNVLPLTKQEFAATDIANKPSRASAEHGDEAAAGTGTGKDSGSADGAGDGPGGERLYNAEWYTRPTHAEMATYLPANGPQEGWGMIACRTVAQYHVEDCQELGESPGSGLARALRQAAWQFRVLPPRIGGRPMIGAWVRIRFDFTNEAK
jgi:protein TonB